MLKVDDAVRKAIEALPGLLGGRKPQGIRVEEVLPPLDDESWKITLSYLEPSDPRPESTVDRLLKAGPWTDAATAPERVLRVIELNAETGSATAMKRYPVQ